MSKFVALLRGINVSGRNRVPMAELRTLCADLGWRDVETYIQSGNVVFAAAGKPGTHEAALEKAVAQAFGVSVPAIVRAGAKWPELIAGNPFAQAAEEEPNRLMLCLAKKPLLDDAGEAIQARARDGEQVRQVGEALWIHYPGGAGTSKLSPSLLDRLAGSPVTARNWRTACKLSDMLAA